ncbi:sporulation protein Cse60 [Paenibacillus sinopodophylli]|uniref:sporulation protein Cse60 n=1 Tax=Paenibacillus sinopodophylli TaxID=1837342 RepID=UPI00110CD54F|nr:sporulation protein Cse60 [Paenibacillus sinopodophylli]
MIQVKEFLDTDTVFAEKRANEFLAELDEDQVVNICYGSMIKTGTSGNTYQRSTILIVYKQKSEK